jgi:hypothetical protein
MGHPAGHILAASLYPQTHPAAERGRPQTNQQSDCYDIEFVGLHNLAYLKSSHT